MINGLGDRSIQNNDWVIGVFNAKGKLVKVYTGLDQNRAAKWASARDGYFVKHLFVAMDSPF